MPHMSIRLSEKSQAYARRCVERGDAATIEEAVNNILARDSEIEAFEQSLIDSRKDSSVPGDSAFWAKRRQKLEAAAKALGK